MEMLKSMKDTLMTQAQSQMGNLSSVDAKELGEVIDMIKDLEEAIYYCTIVEAMEGKDKEEKPHSMYYMPYPRDMERPMGKMYYDGGNSNSMGSSVKGYRETLYDPYGMRDVREGRSPMSRKTYMESKEMHHDKTKQMQELEHYMQELTTDIVEIIEDATPEEKQLLQKKL